MSEQNISLPVAQALASALEKVEAYVPTEYVDNSEPDIDAEHLNHAEQGIMRVTNLLNAAVDVIQGQESRISDTETKVGTAALTGGMTDLSSGVNSLYSNLTIINYRDKITSSDAFSWNKNSQQACVISFPSGSKIALINLAFRLSKSHNSNAQFDVMVLPKELHSNGNVVLIFYNNKKSAFAYLANGTVFATPTENITKDTECNLLGYYQII